MQKLFIIVLLAINLTWATTQDSTVTVVSSYTGISTKVITPSNTMADIGYILGGNIHAKIDSLPPFTVSTQGISTSVNQLVDQYYLLIISHLDSLIQAKLASGDTTGNYYRLQLLRLLPVYHS